MRSTELLPRSVAPAVAGGKEKAVVGTRLNRKSAFRVPEVGFCYVTETDIWEVISRVSPSAARMGKYNDYSLLMSAGTSKALVRDIDITG